MAHHLKTARAALQTTRIADVPSAYAEPLPGNLICLGRQEKAIISWDILEPTELAEVVMANRQPPQGRAMPKKNYSCV
jgi:hypothetical protein